MAEDNPEMKVLERRLMAIHEAGHAIVALKTGKAVSELRIGEEGGWCLTHIPTRKRSWHAVSCLAGVYACRMFCRDNPLLDKWNNWDNCREDLNLFHKYIGGMTFRYARNMAVAILTDFAQDVRDLADVLERDGFVDSTNAPRFSWELTK